MSEQAERYCPGDGRCGSTACDHQNPATIERLTDILGRLRGYNPPDRTIDEQRQIAQDISDAADAIASRDAELADLRARLTEAERWHRAFTTLVEDMHGDFTCEPECSSYGHAETCAVTDPAAAFRALRARLAEAEKHRKPSVLTDRLLAGLAAEADLDDLVYDMHVCEGWFWDYYDYSLEMTGTKNGWLPSAEQWAAIGTAGFVKLYISYEDGSAVVYAGPDKFGACSAREVGVEKHRLLVSTQAATQRAERLEKALREVEAAATKGNGEPLDYAGGCLLEIGMIVSAALQEDTKP